MERNFETEKALRDKWNEWRNMPGLFDFVLPSRVDMTFGPVGGRGRKRESFDEDQSTGRCWPRQAKITICYGNDLPEALHVLLHEICHLNQDARHHDKVFCRSVAHAAEKLTGKRFDYMKPERKLDVDVAVAFGSQARANAVTTRKNETEFYKIKRESQIRNRLTGFNVGDRVAVPIKDRWGGQRYYEGYIADINAKSCRCHVKVITGEVVSRKITSLQKMRVC
jgi:ribosomal protein L21E